MDELTTSILIEMILVGKYNWKQYASYTRDTYEACHVCWEDACNTYILEAPCGHCYCPGCTVQLVLTSDNGICAFCHIKIY